MKKSQDQIELSASDLSNYLACTHMTYLDYCAALGIMERPAYRDPMLAILQERGIAFENVYLQSLREEGKVVAEPHAGDTTSALQNTLRAMHEGADYIYQASLRTGIWQGRADFLRKVETPSKLGNWSYEVIDSKLAKETRAGTILQICLYSQLVADIQEVMPEFMHVMTPDDIQRYRVDDFMAYHRFVQRGIQAAIHQGYEKPYTYPNPVQHCEICRWWQHCDTHRRTDDHLSLIAGISGIQVSEIKKWGIEKLAELAVMPMPLTQEPSRGAMETYVRVREQARLQFEARIRKEPVYELLEIEPGKGLFRLPQPSDGDIFFDFESDAFAGSNGLEYLFGWLMVSEQNVMYTRLWALTPMEEKRAFEAFVDMVITRWETYPDLHIYHYTAYEPTALKRLMGKHGTRGDEIDRMLRAGIFVDLYSIARQSLRAGIERYSLKELEIFHSFDRALKLKDAASQLRTIERYLERNNPADIPGETIESVETYNKDDCLSTKNLRNWLEHLRERLVNSGKQISRPESKSGVASETFTERQAFIQQLQERIAGDVSPDPLQRDTEQQARWILSNMLDWYRQEKKSTWWEYFRLCELPEGELMEEKAAIAGLRFTGQRRPDKKSFIDQYVFPAQECDIREGNDLFENGKKFGEVISINTFTGTIEIRKGPKYEALHPASVFRHTDISDKVKEEAIVRMATWVADNAIDAEGNYRAGRDLLLGHPPRIQSLAFQGNPQEAAVELVQRLDSGVLPIQGPPGSGKSYTAAQMVIALVRSGKKVGITALSHKVIRGLLEKVVKASEQHGLTLTCIEKVTSAPQQVSVSLLETTDNKQVLAALQSGQAQVAAGTAWLWAAEEFYEAVDVLFVDEAGQFSLIDCLAVSQGAKNVVLLGDPQQLKQPQRGSHPEGTEVSALEHILKDKKTIPVDRGIFLNETWRLHPKVCSFISALFYEGRLSPRPDLVNQIIDGNTVFGGAGLWFEPVVHSNNQSSSMEEVARVASIITGLTKGDVFWTNNHRQRRPLVLSDILVIAPYNAQVVALASNLPPGSHVGTVDKFQGQEAPVVIFSMSTSSPEDAPRGMEFLYSLNRLNVAVSRAKSTCIIVASPKLFQPDCKNAGQMKLANAFCRYLELSENNFMQT